MLIRCVTIAMISYYLYNQNTINVRFVKMNVMKSLFEFCNGWINIIAQFIGTFFMTSAAKNLEILALRSQLSLFQQQIENKKKPKPKCTPVFRQLWVLLSKVLPSWESIQIIVKPETVIRWQNTAFRKYWARKSKKKGRPKRKS